MRDSQYFIMLRQIGDKCDFQSNKEYYFVMILLVHALRWCEHTTCDLYNTHSSLKQAFPFIADLCPHSKLNVYISVYKVICIQDAS